MSWGYDDFADGAAEMARLELDREFEKMATTKMEKSKMSETPIYDQALVAEMDRIIETGGDDQQLDDLQRMDDETRPKKQTERLKKSLTIPAQSFGATR